MHILSKGKKHILNYLSLYLGMIKYVGESLFYLAPIFAPLILLLLVKFFVPQMDLDETHFTFMIGVPIIRLFRQREFPKIIFISSTHQIYRIIWWQQHKFLLFLFFNFPSSRRNENWNFPPTHFTSPYSFSISYKTFSKYCLIIGPEQRRPRIRTKIEIIFKFLPLRLNSWHCQLTGELSFQT